MKTRCWHLVCKCIVVTRRSHFPGPLGAACFVCEKPGLHARSVTIFGIYVVVSMAFKSRMTGPQKIVRTNMQGHNISISNSLNQKICRATTIVPKTSCEE